MSQEMMKDFKTKAMDFFYYPVVTEGVKRKMRLGNLYAVLIGGFIGWLFLTLTFGAKLKALLKKVPVVNMLFKKKTLGVRRRVLRAVRRRPARRRNTIANPVAVTAYEEGLTKRQLVAYRAKMRRQNRR